MNRDITCSQFLLRLAAQCREAERAYHQDFPGMPLHGEDEPARLWITKRLLLCAPVTLPKVKGVYLLARNP